MGLLVLLWAKGDMQEGAVWGLCRVWGDVEMVEVFGLGFFHESVAFVPSRLPNASYSTTNFKRIMSPEVHVCMFPSS